MTFTPRQFEILDFIRDYRLENQYSPTMREIADVLKISKVTVFSHIEQLEAKNLIVHVKHKSRSIELTPAGEMLFKPLASVERMSLAAILERYSIEPGIVSRILADVAAAGKVG